MHGDVERDRPVALVFPQGAQECELTRVRAEAGERGCLLYVYGSDAAFMSAPEALSYTIDDGDRFEALRRAYRVHPLAPGAHTLIAMTRVSPSSSFAMRVLERNAEMRARAASVSFTCERRGETAIVLRATRLLPGRWRAHAGVL